VSKGGGDARGACTSVCRCRWRPAAAPTQQSFTHSLETRGVAVHGRGAVVSGGGACSAFFCGNGNRLSFRRTLSWGAANECGGPRRRASPPPPCTPPLCVVRARLPPVGRQARAHPSPPSRPPRTHTGCVPSSSLRRWSQHPPRPPRRPRARRPWPWTGWSVVATGLLSAVAGARGTARPRCSPPVGTRLTTTPRATPGACDTGMLPQAGLRAPDIPCFSARPHAARAALAPSHALPPDENTPTGPHGCAPPRTWLRSTCEPDARVHIFDRPPLAPLSSRTVNSFTLESHASSRVDARARRALGGVRAGACVLGGGAAGVAGAT